jgi:hypothetical protein
MGGIGIVPFTVLSCICINIGATGILRRIEDIMFNLREDVVNDRQATFGMCKVLITLASAIGSLLYTLLCGVGVDLAKYV